MGRVGFITDQSQRHWFWIFFGSFQIYPFLLYFLRRLSKSPAVWVFRILGVLSEERAWIHLFLPQLNYVNALCGQRGSRMLWIPQREDSWAGGWLFLGPGKAANREEVFSNSRREDRRPGFLFATSHRRDLLTILFGKYQQRLKTWNPSVARAGKLPPNKTLRDGILFSFLKLFLLAGAEFKSKLRKGVDRTVYQAWICGTAYQVLHAWIFGTFWSWDHSRFFVIWSKSI